MPAVRPTLLPLAGRTLLLDGFCLSVGVPAVHASRPATARISTLVLIRLAHARPPGGGRGDGDAAASVGRDDIVPPDAFLAAARRQLDALLIADEVGLLTHANGPHEGQPRRQVIRVKNQTHVGYAVIVQHLNADESVRLQGHGLGGRRTMGCGLFLPAGDA